LNLRVLAVDDELLALRRLELLLADMPQVTLIGVARTGEAAIAEIARLKPDVVLLDIKLAGIDGFDVVDALKGPDLPQVVFVTAYDAFAARAFEVRATDYVVKPVQRERLRAALDKARGDRDAMEAGARIAELRATLTRLRARPAADGGEPPTTVIWAERRGELARVAVHLIDWIEAEGDYVRLHAGGERYLMRKTLTSVQAELDPEAFIRIRRSALVQRDRVLSIRRARDRDLRIKLVTGDEIRVGRTYVKDIRAMLAERR
jgi:DNA-binding LytR/AlgR family response regulator